MTPYIVGVIELGQHTIYLDHVRGIYADRGSSRKAGYWVKTVQEGYHKPLKTFYEGLSQEHRRLIQAASTFNQSVEGVLLSQQAK